jgi:hypothetical protein
MKEYTILATKSKDYYCQFTSEDMHSDGFDCPKEYAQFLNEWDTLHCREYSPHYEIYDVEVEDYE